MRLIDGDQLEQRLLDEAARIMADDLYGKDRQRMARGLQKAAEICRAAEVVIDPVKHGRWVYDGQSIEVMYKCSECGYTEFGYDHPIYCPNCGARMDGGTEDETD